MEIYTPRCKAEFLLSNAVDAEDYKAAVREVEKLGLIRREFRSTNYPNEPNSDPGS